jgi:hypothetical protein
LRNAVLEPWQASIFLDCAMIRALTDFSDY